MAHVSHNDLRRFFEAHPSPDHIVVILATDQVQLICTKCGFSVTQDAVDAGLPVNHEEETA